jgi:hypothetical protein
MGTRAPLSGARHQTQGVKWDPIMGVTGMVPYFERAQIDISAKGGAAHKKAMQFRKQLIGFVDETVASHNKNFPIDIVMAAWFPWHRIVRVLAAERGDQSNVVRLTHDAFFPNYGKNGHVNRSGFTVDMDGSLARTRSSDTKTIIRIDKLAHRESMLDDPNPLRSISQGLSDVRPWPCPCHRASAHPQLVLCILVDESNVDRVCCYRRDFSATGVISVRAQWIR